MGIYQRGDRYYYKKEIEGRVYYRALKIKKGQEGLLSRRLEQVEAEVLAEHFDIDYKKNDIYTLMDYIEEYIKLKKNSKKTWSRDRQNLLVMADYLGDIPLHLISRKHIEHLEHQLFKRKIKPSTVNRYFELLRHMLNIALEDGHIRKNPVTKYYIPYTEEGQRRALSPSEVTKILNAAKQIQDNAATKAQAVIYDVIKLGLATGMRLSEIVKLKWGYVHRDTIVFPITVTKSKRRTLTGSKQRVKIVLLNSIAQEIIEKHRGQDEAVFDLPERESHAIFRKTVHKIRKDTGINDFTFHQLRHTVSTVLSSRVSLTVAKEVLGHADIRTTLRYSHVGEEQREGVAKIEEYLKEIGA